MLASSSKRGFALSGRSGLRRGSAGGRFRDGKSKTIRRVSRRLDRRRDGRDRIWRPMPKRCLNPIRGLVGCLTDVFRTGLRLNDVPVYGLLIR
jgi:hypothetical protein